MSAPRGEICGSRLGGRAKTEKRRRLGQHFLKSEGIARRIVEAARIGGDDIVLEVGTGRGILTTLLCDAAKRVISAESDMQLYRDAKSRVKRDNLKLIHGDGFSVGDPFTVFVSNLPYSKSRKAIEWLAQRDFARAVVTVQREFAEKLLTESRRKRRAVTVIARHAFAIDEVFGVGRDDFDPPPRIDSAVIRLEKRVTLSRGVIVAVNGLFSHRRKILRNVPELARLECGDRMRLEDLEDGEVIRIATRIAG